MPIGEGSGYLVKELDGVWKNDKDLFYTHDWE